VELTQSEQQREKRMKKSEDTLRVQWDNIKWTNSHIRGVPEGEEEEKGAEIVFEEIIAESVPNLEKETNIQIQEAQRAPKKMKQK